MLPCCVPTYDIQPCHGLYTLTAVPRSTQPSTLRGMVKRVSAFGLSNNIKWRWWVWLLAAYRQTHSLGRLAWSEGWRRCIFIIWTGWTLDDSTINIIINIIIIIIIIIIYVVFFLFKQPLFTRPSNQDVSLCAVLWHRSDLVAVLCLCVQTKCLSVSNKESACDVVRRCLTELHIAVNSLYYCLSLGPCSEISCNVK